MLCHFVLCVLYHLFKLYMLFTLCYRYCLKYVYRLYVLSVCLRRTSLGALFYFITLCLLCVVDVLLFMLTCVYRFHSVCYLCVLIGCFLSLGPLRPLPRLCPLPRPTRASLTLSLSLSIYIYMHIYVCVYMYINIILHYTISYCSIVYIIMMHYII